MRSTALATGLFVLFTTNADAALIGTDWTADASPDGQATGTLGALAVTLNSTDGAVNGGVTFAADWPNRLGTNDVPGIAGLAGANRNAIDWNSGSPGFATITFTGGSAVNPILLFDFTDPNQTFDFEDSLTLSVLDQSPAASVSIAAGNVVTFNGAPSNGQNDSFALQLVGSFTDFTFVTNGNGLSAASVGFSIAVEETAVPEPSSLLMMGIGLIAVALRRRGSARPLAPTE